MNASRMAAVAALVVALGSALAACGDPASVADDATLTVYVSAPLSGPARADGDAVAEGVREALADAGGEAGGVEVVAEFLDVAGRNESRFDAVTAARNARTATEDSTAIAYVGELDSSATRTSLPITNEAGILQVAPGSGASDLVREEVFSDEVPIGVQTTGERTYIQLAPTYDADEEDPTGVDPRQAGFDAMALILDAVERSEDPADRELVVDAAFADPGVLPTGELRASDAS